MQRIILTILLLTLNLLVIAQSISGVVIDKETSKPVRDAHILFENTAMQIFTNKQGRFQLDKETRGMNFVVSHLSYKLVSRDVPLEGSKLDTIYLERAAAILANIVIKDDKAEKLRKDRIKQFKKDLFDSETISGSLSKKIELLNPEVILFEQRGDTLLAYSDQLIRFRNKYLGYEMQLYLVEYLHMDRLAKVTGKAFFEPFDTESKFYNRSIIETRKRDIWIESEQAFFQTLLINDLNLQVPIYEKRDNGLFHNFSNVQDLYKRVFKTKYDGIYALLAPYQLYVNRGKKITEIGSDSKLILFNEQGVVLNKEDYKEIGYWQRKSITELLPNSYCKNVERAVKEMYSKSYSIGDLKSRAMDIFNSYKKNEVNTVELITDKFYYGLTDRIYVDARTYDYQRMKASSEDEILYVELIDQNNVVVDQKIRQVRNGSVSLVFDISDNYQGLYNIRAYTDYMKAFGEESYAYKSIAVRMRKANSDAHSVQIKSYPEGGKYQYATNNRVVMKICNADNEAIPFSAVLKDNYLDTSYIINTLADGIAMIDIPVDSQSVFEIVHKELNLNHDLNNHPEHASETGLQVLDRRDYYRISAMNSAQDSSIRLQISQRGSEVYSARIDESVNRFKIEKDYIPRGMLLIAILDKDNQILNHRYINNKPSQFLEVKNEYSYCYTGQAVSLDIVNNMDDSLMCNIRVVHSDFLNSANIISNPKIEHISLMAKEIPYHERFYYDKDIPNSTRNKAMSLKGRVTDLDDEPVKSYVSMQTWSSNPYIQELLTDDDGYFEFMEMPFMQNQQCVLQARIHDDKLDNPMEGNREVKIEVIADSVEVRDMAWEAVPNIEKAEDSLDSVYQVSFGNAVMLNEIDIEAKTDYFKTQVRGTYILHNIDWIGDQMNAISILQSLYPRSRIKSDINTASDYLIFIRSPKEKYVPLEVYVNGTRKSGGVLNSLRKNEIMSMNLSRNLLFIRTYPNGQTKEEAYPSFHGIETIMLNETKEDFNPSQLQPNKYAGTNLDERTTLYWNSEMKFLAQENKSINFITSQKEGNYTLIATTYHPEYGKIEQRYPIVVKARE